MSRRVASLAVICLAAACSNADLYSKLGEDPLLPDRLTVAGELCTEDTSGSKFPVKVLFAIDASTDAFLADPNGQRFSGPPGSINSIIQRNRFQPHVSFGFIGISSISSALPTPDGQRFFRPQDPEIQLAIGQLQVPLGTPNQNGNRDVINALSQIGSFIMSDIADSSAGEVLRTRYLVSMFLAGPSFPNPNTNKYARTVEGIAEQVYAAGALEFSVNVGLQYYGPDTIDQGTINYDCYPAGTAADPLCDRCSSTVTGGGDYCAVYCAVDAGLITEARNTRARTAYEAIAFAGGGLFRQYPCPANINLGVDVASANVQLIKKDIVAFNRNVRLGLNGPELDSDGDGLSDIEEIAATPSTSPANSDTDEDGLADKLEFRTYPRQSPVDGTDRPASCIDPAIFGTIPDRDIDLLNDCEEGLLQTSPTIPDSDGDGLPDLLEFLGGTIPISADDRLLDFDADGFSNADEVLEHTNPRSHDGPLRGEERYRNRIVDLGMRKVASMEDPPQLRGVVFKRASPGLVGGQAYMHWDACTRTLEWSDASWPPLIAGAQAYEPVPEVIPDSGEYTLRAQTCITRQGATCVEVGEEIWAEFDITEEFMPTCADAPEVTAFPLITVSDRRCYDVRISNIKLMETAAANGGTAVGLNTVLVFFTQAPESRLTAPGISKMAEILVQFRCPQPELPAACVREPDDGTFVLTDDLFVSAVP